MHNVLCFSPNLIISIFYGKITSVPMYCHHWCNWFYSFYFIFILYFHVFLFLLLFFFFLIWSNWLHFSPGEFIIFFYSIKWLLYPLLIITHLLLLFENKILFSPTWYTVFPLRDCLSLLCLSCLGRMSPLKHLYFLFMPSHC